MYLEFMKNPIFIGVLASAITYLYLMWDIKKKNQQKSFVKNTCLLASP